MASEPDSDGNPDSDSPTLRNREQDSAGGEFHAWNPGLESTIPSHLRHLTSMFQPGSISNTLDEIDELSSFCGLPAVELAAFKPERLLVHELLVRVSADLSVPDGPAYEDLGINMRGMVATILDNHVYPELPALTRRFEAIRSSSEQFLRETITPSSSVSGDLPESTGSGQPSESSLVATVSRWLNGSKRAKSETTERAARFPDKAIIDTWTRQLSHMQASEVGTNKPDADLQACCLNHLVAAAKSIVTTRGALMGDPELLVKIALTGVCNEYGSKVLRQEVEPVFDKAVVAEGYQVLPAQAEPFVMNVKGASASGKSTIRTLQRELAERLGVSWENFALISPDYWRKFLLDYDSLGEHYKYAGVLTGHELAIIDSKLDDYMSNKASSGCMSHLLIDRFRFDSFSVGNEGEAGTRLLTRFGKTVFLFFMVTPPEATVERAWLRGIQTGRYKSVDDLLHHNIEAYTGMPMLFLSWALSTNRSVHFEFLDNSVALGEKPRTIASGWNRSMTIYDVEGLKNIEKFKKIQVSASHPDEVYLESAEENNWGFLQECANKLERIVFKNTGAGDTLAETYGEMRDGQWAWLEQDRVPDSFEPAKLGSGELPDSSGEEHLEYDLDSTAEHLNQQWGNADIGAKPIASPGS